MTYRLAAIIALATTLCCPPAALAVQISFDYRFDSGFFTQSRRDLLQQAGNAIGSRLSDTLLPIAPSGSNTYEARLYDPSKANTTTGIFDLNIATDTLVVFAAAYDQGGSTLGTGGPGWIGMASGDGGFLNTVKARGQAGALGTPALRTDFGPWGGSVSFNSANSNWYFDPDPNTSESFSGDDFYSVALHEIGHVLGYGTADSWDNLASGGTSGGSFSGPQAEAVFGGPVPLEPGTSPAHWAAGTASLVAGLPQEAAMDPTLTVGSRKLFTDLDYAGLQDIGWQVSSVPLPAPLLLLASGLTLLLGMCRKRS